MSKQKPNLTCQEVSDRLTENGYSVTRETVRQWMVDGRNAGEFTVSLRYRKVGAKRLTRWSWVMDFFDELEEADSRARRKAIDSIAHETASKELEASGFGQE